MAEVDFSNLAAQYLCMYPVSRMNLAGVLYMAVFNGYWVFGLWITVCLAHAGIVSKMAAWIEMVFLFRYIMVSPKKGITKHQTTCTARTASRNTALASRNCYRTASRNTGLRAPHRSMVIKLRRCMDGI